VVGNRRNRRSAAQIAAAVASEQQKTLAAKPGSKGSRPTPVPSAPPQGNRHVQVIKDVAGLPEGVGGPVKKARRNQRVK
jgi:hypothetical protein